MPPNPALASIAARLVHARQAAGLGTPEAAAIRLGMNPKVYATHEQARSGVKPAELCRYAEAFGVSHGWLSTGIGAGPKKVG